MGTFPSRCTRVGMTDTLSPGTTGAEPHVGLEEPVSAAFAGAVQEEDRRPAQLRRIIGGDVDLIVIRSPADGDAAIEKSGLHLLHRQSNTEHQKEHVLRSCERLIYDP